MDKWIVFIVLMYLLVFFNVLLRVNGNIVSIWYGIWIMFYLLYLFIRIKDVFLFFIDGVEDWSK